jgi:tol-pal system protein YbgF
MRRLALLTLATVGLLLPACATRTSVHDTNARLGAVAKDVADVRQQQQAATRDTGAIVADIRALTARVREAEARQRETSDRVASLGNRMAAAEASLREVTSGVEALQRPPAAVGAPSATSPAAAAETAFAAALKTFRAGEHGQAVLEFTDFIGKYPKHPLAARAQLWIGDAYFRQRDYRQALLEYRKAVESAAPDSTSAADAWLKVGEAYASLRERPAATAAWKRVMRDYPRTEAASQARALLRK